MLSGERLRGDSVQSLFSSCRAGFGYLSFCWELNHWWCQRTVSSAFTLSREKNWKLKTIEVPFRSNLREGKAQTFQGYGVEDRSFATDVSVGTEWGRRRVDPFIQELEPLGAQLVRIARRARGSQDQMGKSAQMKRLRASLTTVRTANTQKPKASQPNTQNPDNQSEHAKTTKPDHQGNIVKPQPVHTDGNHDTVTNYDGPKNTVSCPPAPPERSSSSATAPTLGPLLLVQRSLRAPPARPASLPTPRGASADPLPPPGWSEIFRCRWGQVALRDKPQRRTRMRNGPRGARSSFKPSSRSAMWACCYDTSSNDDDRNTSNAFLLQCAGSRTRTSSRSPWAAGLLWTRSPSSSRTIPSQIRNL